MMSDILASRYVADDVWFSGIWICSCSWWCLIFWLLGMYLMMSDFLAAGYAADDVWFPGTGYVAFTWWCLIFWLLDMYVMMSSFFGCWICCCWCLIFWHLDMKLRMSHFLAAECVADDVWFSGTGYVALPDDVWFAGCSICTSWCLIFSLVDV